MLSFFTTKNDNIDSPFMTGHLGWLYTPINVYMHIYDDDIDIYDHIYICIYNIYIYIN